MRAHRSAVEAGRTDDLLDTPAARILRHVAQNGPIKMRRFTEVSQHAPKHAKILREEMEAKGWLVVHDVAKRPTTTDMEIDLTPDGRRLAEASLALEEAEERARKKRTAASDRRN